MTRCPAVIYCPVVISGQVVTYDPVVIYWSWELHMCSPDHKSNFDFIIASHHGQPKPVKANLEILRSCLLSYLPASPIYCLFSRTLLFVVAQVTWLLKSKLLKLKILLKLIAVLPAWEWYPFGRIHNNKIREPKIHFAEQTPPNKIRLKLLGIIVLPDTHWRGLSFCRIHTLVSYTARSLPLSKPQLICICQFFIRTNVSIVLFSFFFRFHNRRLLWTRQNALKRERWKNRKV